jgi:hypothetical protein
MLGGGEVRADRAFERVYRRHVADVYRYACAVLANPTDAEDVSQTVFLNADGAFQNGTRPDEPLNWLIAISAPRSTTSTAPATTAVRQQPQLSGGGPPRQKPHGSTVPAPRWPVTTGVHAPTRPDPPPTPTPPSKGGPPTEPPGVGPPTAPPGAGHGKPQDSVPPLPK